MTADRLIVGVIFLLVIGGGVWLQTLRGAATSSATAGTTAAAPAKAFGGQIRGIALQLQGGDNGQDYTKYIAEIAETGANTIYLVVAGLQEDASSRSIYIDVRSVPGKEKIAQVIAAARQRNLRTILMPIVLPKYPKSGEWRGKIDPSKHSDGGDQWWGDYTSFITYFADIAAANKVDALVVGSELIWTEEETERWVAVIEKVRQHFDGPLCYSSNWDHYTVPKFWDKLDMVGMTTYYDLTNGKEPSMETLLEAWSKIRQDVLTWQKEVNRPILFTEVGWPNQVSAAQYPWNYYASPDKPDPQLQKRLFEAFFRTWKDEPSVAGWIIWEWRSNDSDDTSPQKDTGYCPKDKPAMDVIRQYFRQGAGPAVMPSTSPATSAPTTSKTPQPATATNIGG